MGNRDIAAVRVLEGARLASNRLAFACILGWLLPGAGHWYLGRRTRAGVFFSLVTLSFLLGVIFHGRFSVQDRRQPILTAFQVVACLGSGPMEIIARTVLYGAPVYRMPEEDDTATGEVRRPRTTVARSLRFRTEQFDSVYGTAYLWAAGLMNLLLILDVFDIGIGRKD